MADDSVFKLKYNDTVSSLSQAAAMGDLKSVQRLLTKGRLPQATDNRGWSAVHSCVAANQLEALKLILNFRKGSKKYLTNLTTWEGETPLVLALESDSVSVDIITLLLKSGCNVNKATNEAMTALHYACKRNGNVSAVRVLIKHGARVDVKENINEYTPLHFAIVEAADLDIIKVLVERCDVNLADVDNETPVYKASVCNFFEAVELMLKKDSSSVNVIPRSRFSALSAAAFNGNERLVRLLLDAGANADTPGSGTFHRYPLNEGNTLPIHLSAGNPEIFRIFLNVMNPQTLLKHEEGTSLAVYAMMYGPGSECFEALLETALPGELDPVKIVDSGRVADFIMGFPYRCDEILEKFHLLFKYCIHLDAGKVLKHVGNTARGYEPKKLLDKLQFLRLLARIGVYNGFESKVIQVLREVQEDRDEVTEVIDMLCQPVLTLKQMSRDAARRYILSRAEKSWGAYTIIRDLHLPADMKQYLWCQVLS